MPQFARTALTQKLERSGLLDRLVADARILFRKRLQFLPELKDAEENAITVPLQVGAVHLGYLCISGTRSQSHNEAHRRWLTMACRIFANELSTPSHQSNEVLPASIRLAAQLVRERYDLDLTLGDLASEVGLSREHLSRLFHEALGITFSAYLNEVRLGEAKRRLSLGQESVTDIAYASGFQSLSQFNRRFKSAEGISPRAYRQRFVAATMNEIGPS